MDEAFEEEWPVRFDPEVGPEHVPGSRIPGYEEEEVGGAWFVSGLFYDIEQGQWVPGRMTLEDFGRMLAYQFSQEEESDE